MSAAPHNLPSKPEYAWEIAKFFPLQGEWLEEDYLEITAHENHRVEFVNGRLDFQQMPTYIHESLLHFLLFKLQRFVGPQELGKVFSNGIRVRVGRNKVRLPDVLFVHRDHYDSIHDDVWDGVDLAIEVVGEDPRDRDRNYQEKFAEYAEAGIAEYWIIDYQQGIVIVHRLENGQYTTAGEYQAGQHARSTLLDGFEIDVTALFAEANDVPD